MTTTDSTTADAPAAAPFESATAITADPTDGRAPVLSTRAALQGPASAIAGAELLATAHGIYEASLNGARATDSVLNPGWTVYESRLQVQRFDVTEQARSGGEEIELSVLLGRGWWNGDFGFGDAASNYGDENALLAALVITYADGSTQTVATDETWTATDSPITFATIYDGQHEDRTLAAGDPRPVRVTEIDRSTLIEQASPLITRHETRRPEKIWTSPSGKTLLDFGQNLVGWLRFTVTGPAGTEITLRHAEVLEHEELGTRPLRAAKATDQLVLSGDVDGDYFEPTFTFHGFRYAEVTGWPGELAADDIEAVFVHSAIAPTARFSCSEPLVDRLVENTARSQRGNFLSLPTDCPQRDERLGWTGDIAVFAPTAAFSFDVADFLHDWLLDVRAETEHASAVPFVVPDLIKLFDRQVFPPSPTAVWGDAAVWVPEALWRAYGDRDRLAEHYPGMVLHLRSVERVLSATGLWDTGFQFGDWLDPDAPPERADAAKADKGVVATASLFRSASFAAETATLLGEHEDAAHWRALAARTRAAFREHYIGRGRIRSDCATVYALAIRFGLLDGADRAAAGDRLAEIVRESGYRVTTGFAGTPYVTWALSETGHVAEAYRLLLEKECPSWLYPVTMGATTIWERWDSMLPDGTINPGGMTSFNHYALGGVVDWIHQVIGGIRAAEPGYRRVRIEPVPGPGIDRARLSFDSPVGLIETSWHIEQGVFRLETTIPDGIPTEVMLPDGTAHAVSGGAHSFEATVSV